MGTFRPALAVASLALCLASNARASELIFEPAAVFHLSFGSVEGRWVHEGRMLARLEYAQDSLPFDAQGRAQPSLAELDIADSGSAAFRVNGLNLVTKTPLVNYAVDSAERAESSWFVANWKTIALATVGVAALAVSGGGGGSSEEQGPTDENSCVYGDVANGNGGPPPDADADCIDLGGG
jgi:hypothetical protein